jgi:hypothetical protein
MDFCHELGRWTAAFGAEKRGQVSIREKNET